MRFGRTVGGDPPAVARTRTPVIQQMEVTECGAAALAMVLGYFGRYVPLAELRVRCDVSHDGARAAVMLRAGREYGLTAEGRSLDIADLPRLSPPAILFWHFNHYVVYEGTGRRFGRRVWYLNDPAAGRRVVPHLEFRAGFTGVVLTFRPGPAFCPGGRPPQPLRELRGRFRPAARAMLAGLTTALILTVAGLVIPVTTQAFVDLVLLPADPARAAPILVALGAAVVVLPVLRWAQLEFLSRAQLQASSATAIRLMRRLLRLPVAFLDRREPAELASRVAAADTLTARLTHTTASAVASILAIGVYAALLWGLDAWLALVGIAVVLLRAGLISLATRPEWTGAARVRSARAELLAVTAVSLRRIETVKVTDGEPDLLQRWSQAQAALAVEQRRADRSAAVLTGVDVGLSMAAAAVVLVLGGWHAVDGVATVGMLLAFQQILHATADPVGELVRLAPRYREAGMEAARLHDIEAAEPDAVFGNPEHVGRVDGGVAAANVTFGYRRLEPPLLSDITFEVPPGGQLAVVGASGSGKSTVAALLAGRLKPWTGDIRFSGRRLGDLPRGVLAGRVAVVDNRNPLFEGTVRDNITLWDSTIDTDDILTALRDAAVYDTVTRRPGDIHTMVGAGGGNFSGGQRQCLRLARALVRSPSVVVLDDATSELDPASERAVYRNLRRRGCTRVVLTHRPAAVRDSDEILVLDAGRVVERGTHDQLIAVGGRYATMAGQG